MSQKVEAARRANSALAECAQREIPSLDDRISQAPVIASGLYYACLTEAVIAVAARAAVTGQRASEEIDEMKAGQDLLLLDVVLRYRAAQR